MSEQTTVQTLSIQNIVNRVVRTVLRTPGIDRLAGRRLVTIHVVGHKTGRQFDVPVAYTRDGDDLLVGTSFPWGRNLATGVPVELQLQGRRRTADVTVYTDRDDVVDLYRLMCRDNRQFAKFNEVRLQVGEPDVADIEKAWRGGARVFRLSLRER